MTNYNDGNWHGCNGGECPVHKLSDVEVVYISPEAPGGMLKIKGIAQNRVWDKGNIYHNPIAFRVVKPYVEPPKPREVWINEYGGGHGVVHYTELSARAGREGTPGKTTRWIEVLE